MKSLATKHSFLGLGVMVGVVTLLLSIGLALAAGETLPRTLVASGGGQMSAAGVHLHSAVGQPIAGTVGNGIVLNSGFLSGPRAPSSIDRDVFVFLPLVQK